MEKASEEMRFEKAAALRDQLKAIQSIIERQKIVFASDYLDSDVLAMARSDGEACVQIFFIRGGKLIGREYFILEGTEDDADTEVMAAVRQAVLHRSRDHPAAGDAAAGDRRSPDHQPMAAVASAAAKRSSSSSPRRVSRANWCRWQLKMPPRPCRPCARSGRQIRTSRNRRSPNCSQALNLPEPPNRIECYDISNTQGTAIVGAMVVFTQGVPDKKLYRKFNIESVVGAPDDFASMEEMLTRRFRRWRAARKRKHDARVQAGCVVLLPA